MIAFIDDHRALYGIEPICRVLPIAPSTYHAQAARRADPERLPARVGGPKGVVGARQEQHSALGGAHALHAQPCPNLAMAFPGEVRRILYTTNAIEALNATLRRAGRARGHFPTDEAALKLLYLVLNRSEKAWKMGPREWIMAKAQFAVIFGERFTRAMAD